MSKHHKSELSAGTVSRGVPTRLYTKTGDRGFTSLYDGRRIGKQSLIFGVLGDLDELTAHIGVLCATNPDGDNTMFRGIQSDLLDIGSNIAVTDPKKKDSVPQITDEHVTRLEHCIDEIEEKNEPLTAFILPGVRMADAQAHVCRTVARRVERSLWRLDQCEDEESLEKKGVLELAYVQVTEPIMQYINRLSDLFFALARNLSGCAEAIK